jgi:hypothetical protein
MSIARLSSIHAGKAVYAYALEHYADWRREYPQHLAMLQRLNTSEPPAREPHGGDAG